MMIVVGKVLKAQGILGEVKISCLLDDSKQLKGLNEIYMGDTPMQIDGIRIESAEICYLKLHQITDRNTAESFRGACLYVEKDKIKLDEGRYFIDDIIGCMVFAGGQEIGKLIEVIPCASADVFTCQKDGKCCRFPFLKVLIEKVDIENKSIQLNKDRLSEVIVYED